jgi:hypothetical protein
MTRVTHHRGGCQVEPLRANPNLNVSYEGVLWNLKTSWRPEADGELRHARCVDYNLGDNALLQACSTRSSTTTPRASAAGVSVRDDKPAAVSAVAQLSVKF